jgi:hypothetical protein
MDWLPLLATVGLPALSIVATAGVTIGAKAMDLKARNAERRHEIALDLSSRMWDAKRAALLGIIGSCVRIKQRCQPVASDGGDSELRAIEQRAEAIRALAQERKDLDNTPGGRGALIAWAEEPTRQAIEQLLELIDAEVEPWRSALGNLEAALQLQRDALGALPKELGSPEVKKRLDEARSFSTLARDHSQEIGSGSNLDLEALADLCDKVIRGAREDLRGQHGPAGN